MPVLLCSPYEVIGTDCCWFLAAGVDWFCAEKHHRGNAAVVHGDIGPATMESNRKTRTQRAKACVCLVLAEILLEDNRRIEECRWALARWCRLSEACQRENEPKDSRAECLKGRSISAPFVRSMGPNDIKILRMYRDHVGSVALHSGVSSSALFCLADVLAIIACEGSELLICLTRI